MNPITMTCPYCHNPLHHNIALSITFCDYCQATTNPAMPFDDMCDRLATLYDPTEFEIPTDPRIATKLYLFMPPTSDIQPAPASLLLREAEIDLDSSREGDDDEESDRE